MRCIHVGCKRDGRIARFIAVERERTHITMCFYLALPGIYSAERYVPKIPGQRNKNETIKNRIQLCAERSGLVFLVALGHRGIGRIFTLFEVQIEKRPVRVAYQLPVLCRPAETKKNEQKLMHNYLAANFLGCISPIRTELGFKTWATPALMLSRRRHNEHVFDVECFLLKVKSLKHFPI